MKNLLLFIAILTTGLVRAQSGEFHLDKEYAINQTGTIDLISSDAKVFITGSSRSKVHIKIDRVVTAKGWTSSDEKFEVAVEEENGNLEIREKQSGSFSGMFGYYKEDYKIEIEAPEGITLVVRGDDGDYFIKNINGSISLSLDDADAELSDCGGSNFKFRLDDGDVRMNQGKGNLEINADDANVSIYKGQFSSIQSHIEDGDLIIETTLVNDGKYSLSSEDGAITMTITGGGGTFEIRHDDSHVMTNGDFKIHTRDEHFTKVSLASGSAAIDMRMDDANVKLTAN